MDLIKYLKHPNTYIATAMVAAPVLGGLARLLAGGDFLEGAKQILAPPNDALYLAGTLVFVMFDRIYQRRPANIEQKVNGVVSK